MILDLKQRGLLEDTLVVWGGEFGRTPMGESRKTTGRDHHIDAFTMWMAGAGLIKGYIHGKSDELTWEYVEHLQKPVKTTENHRKYAEHMWKSVEHLQKS